MCLAVPGEIIAIWDDDGTSMGRVSFGNVTKDVCLAYVPDIQVGEYTIVHVGFALQRLDEKSALETLEIFRKMGELDASSATSGVAPRSRPGCPARPDGGHVMKYLDEFRDPELAKRLLDAIAATVTRPWTIMEVCGGQTHTIVKYGHRPAPAAGGRAGPRARLPGLRHLAGDDRPRPRHRLAAGRDLLLVRRHAPRPGLARRPVPAQVAGRRRPRRLFAARRRRIWRRRTPTARWSSSPSASRRPPRPTRWPSGWPGSRDRQLQRAGLARPGAAGDDRDPRARPATACRRSSAAGHVCTVMGTSEYEPIGRALRGADRGHRLRAARPARRDAADRAAARGGPGRGREPVPAGGLPRTGTRSRRAARGRLRGRATGSGAGSG